MKQFYLLLTFLVALTSFGQGTPIITMIADGDETGGKPKVVEIYANGTVNFDNYTIEKQANANTNWVNPLDLSTLSIGTVTDAFIYIYRDNDQGAYAANFASVTSSSYDVGNHNALAFNGDDSIRIIETGSGNVVDVFGVDGQSGSGTSWQYTDGYAKRIDGTGPENPFVEANWIGYNGALNGHGANQDGTTYESIIGLGTYSPVASSNPSLTITSPLDGSTLAPTTSVDVAFTVQNFNVAQTGGDGHIAWDLDNSGTWTMQYDTNPIALTGLSAGSHTVDLKLVDNSGNDLNPAVEASVTFEIATYTQVSTLADLRAGTLNQYYHFTGEAFVLGGYGNTNVKGFVQDATAGIKVFANASILTNQPTVGDGITDLKGMLKEYHGVLEIELTEDFTMTGNNQVQTPQVVTIADYLANHDDYESELIKFENVTVDANGDTQFQGSHNYNVTDGTDNVNLRTAFPDLAGETIPAGTVHITGIGAEYNGNAQFFPRDINDFETPTVTTPALTITSPANGTIFTPDVTDVDVTFTVQNFNVAQSGGDGHIAWDLDNSGTWTMQYDTNPIALTGLSAGSHTVDIKLVDDSDNDLTPAVEASVTFETTEYTQVATLADLRAGTIDSYYHFTGNANIIGGRVSSSGNVTGFIQDATAGMMVYVHAGTTTNQPTNGDEITDIKGKLKEYNGMLEIELTEDFTMTGNNQAVTPQVVTIADYLANHEEYESELIKFENVTIDPAGDTQFQFNHNYDVTDGTDTVNLRTFSPDLENQTIPTSAQNITGIASEYNGTPQFYPRDINDFEDYVGIAENNIEGLEVYPNPASNQVYVTSASGNAKQIAIYDLLGKTIFQAEINDGQAVNINQLQAGVYLMKITENNQIALQKLIIK